jgi:deoxyribonuclease-4
VGVVVHFGVYKGDNLLDGYRNIVKWVDQALDGWTGSAKILLENQAGDHGPMGTTPEELATIRSLSARPEAIGFCLDTCHLFASGQWNGTNWDEFRERAGKLAFWDGLAVVHLNDSRYPSGSGRDRHARIGEGFIGADGFRELLRTPELDKVPLILETPVGQDGTHAGQIARVRQLSGMEE